jgi:hypothetical protein
MLFAPSETDGFDLVHTAKEYLEVIPNPARVALDPAIPLWDGESMDVDVPPRIGSKLRTGYAEIDNVRVETVDCGE